MKAVKKSSPQSSDCYNTTKLLLLDRRQAPQANPKAGEEDIGSTLPLSLPIFYPFSPLKWGHPCQVAVIFHPRRQDLCLAFHLSSPWMFLIGDVTVELEIPFFF